MSLRGIRSPALLPLALILLSAAAANVVWADQLTIRVIDQHGAPIAARIHAKDSAGVVPPNLDPILLSHRHWPHMGAYVWADSAVTLTVQPGNVELQVGRGFESKPQTLTVFVSGHREITVTVPHYFDLQAAGWHSGDIHVHASHTPSEYTIEPEDVARVLRAEDLNVAWLLDGTHHFTGGPHPLSTDDHAFWYTTEYRNQAYGHAALLGLTSSIGSGCCTPPAAAYPLLSDTRESWNPGLGKAMVLCHPCTAAGFFDDGGWPAWGLGREAPVLAASGNLDAYDIASHSNEDDICLDDWYGLLSSGIQVPPSAGTDTAINNYWTRPAGSYRVYAYTGAAEVDLIAWVEALKSGRSFVTNYPLIPEFTVDGSPAGSTLDLAGPTQQVLVSFRVRSVLPLEKAEILVNGEVYSSHPLVMGPTVLDQQINQWVTLEESSWLAVRVSGTTTLWHAVQPELFAHTGPVYLHLDGTAPRDPAQSAYFLTWLEDLHAFVDQRGGWAQSWHADHVHIRIENAADHFRETFAHSPSAPALLVPAPGDTVEPLLPVEFRWGRSTDPDEGDQVSYRLELEEALTGEVRAYDTAGDTSAVLLLDPIPVGTYRWRTIASDLGGHETGPNEIWRTVEFVPNAADLDPIPASTPGDPLRWHPNPFRESIHLDLPAGTTEAGVRIYDVRGRQVRVLGGNGRSAVLSAIVWDGRDDSGVTLPAGTYWAEVRTTRGFSRERIVLLR